MDWGEYLMLLTIEMFIFLILNYIQENKVVLVHSRPHNSWTKTTCTASHQVSTKSKASEFGMILSQIWKRAKKQQKQKENNFRWKRASEIRAEEANLGGSVLPRQQSALLCEAVATEPKGLLKTNLAFLILTLCPQQCRLCNTLMNDWWSIVLRLRRLDRMKNYAMFELMNEWPGTLRLRRLDLSGSFLSHIDPVGE